MATPSLTSLLIQQTQAQIYQGFLTLAQTVGLPVTAWQAGDPTRTLFNAESSVLAVLEPIVVNYIKSRFLDFASNDGNPNGWLTIAAQQDYGVAVPGASYATTTETLTNSGGGFYDFAPGDLTFANPSTTATYHNTTGGILLPSGTLTVDIEADQPGSASTSGAGEITTLVTAYPGVTCTNPAAAIGIDSWSDTTIVQQCRDSLAAVSPNGPAQAYEYIARNTALTGILTVTKARTYPSPGDNGAFLMAVAGPGSAAIGSSDIAAVQAAIDTWAQPLGSDCTVVAANPVTVPITYTLTVWASVNQTSSQIQASVLTSLEAMIAQQLIGGAVIPPAALGVLDLTLISSTIMATFAQSIEVALSLPATALTLNANDVPVLGTVSGTITFVQGG